MPDSRAEAEGRESAKRERAARARAASSGGQQPSKRQSRKKGVSPGGFERTAFQDAFPSFKRIFDRKSKITVIGTTKGMKKAALPFRRTAF